MQRPSPLKPQLRVLLVDEEAEHAARVGDRFRNASGNGIPISTHPPDFSYPHLFYIILVPMTGFEPPKQTAANVLWVRADTQSCTGPVWVNQTPLSHRPAGTSASAFVADVAATLAMRYAEFPCS